MKQNITPAVLFGIVLLGLLAVLYIVDQQMEDLKTELLDKTLQANTNVVAQVKAAIEAKKDTVRFYHERITERQADAEAEHREVDVASADSLIVLYYRTRPADRRL